MNVGQHDSACKWITRAIQADRQNGMPWHLARDYALYANFLAESDDPQSARQVLEKAVALFQTCGADGWAARHERRLAAMTG